MSKTSKPKPVVPADIYTAYRHTLKSITPRNRSGRAGERKQRARQIVADRYHVPVSYVKQIVNEQDEIKGIEHNHNPGYKEAVTRKLDLAKAQNLYAGQACACGNYQVVRARYSNSIIDQEGNAVIIYSCFLCATDDNAWNDDARYTADEIIERRKQTAALREQQIAQGKIGSLWL